MTELESLIRMLQIRVTSQGNNDVLTPAQILNVLANSVTQDDFEQYVLSQIREVIWGNNSGAHHWYENFTAAGVPSLYDLKNGILTDNSYVGIELGGVKNGSNRLFTTPVDYIHVPGHLTIEVYHNGHILKQSLTDVTQGDYLPIETGGPLTGYDAIQMLSFPPVSSSDLSANFIES
jgi:hypothetical protein